MYRPPFDVRDPQPERRVVAQAFSDIESRSIDWCWRGRIPDGMLTILMGNEGDGKTAAGLSIVAGLTRGTLPGAQFGRPVTCAVLAPEDDASAVLRPRLEAAGADLNRVLLLQTKADDHDTGLSLPDDTELLMAALQEHAVEFVFADPLASLLNPGLNSWKDTDIRQALEPLVGQLAQQRITMVGTLHTNKSRSTDPREKGMGSVGWRQICRSQLYLGPDPEAEEDEQDRRCLAHTKCNVGRLQRTVRVQHESVRVLIGGHDSDMLHARLGEECDVTAAAMLKMSSGATKQEQRSDGENGRNAPARVAATEWLEALIRGNGGAMPVPDVRAEATAAGHSWGTVIRARDDAGFVARQRTGAAHAGWEWAASAPAY